MAEERLIDTDKDKKYRIRKNADGEDELYVVEGEDVAEDEDTVRFYVEENSAEQEPSSAAETAVCVGEEEATQNSLVVELLEKARTGCEEGKFSTAAEYLEKVIELAPENGEAYALELAAYTKNFTDYSKIGVVVEYCAEIERCVGKAAKDEILSRCEGDVKNNIERLTGEIAELDRNNEQQKQVRAKKFLSDRRRAIVIFACVCVALCACIGGCVYGFINVYAVKDSNVNLILAIVFGVLSVACLVGLAVAARTLFTACRRVRLNKNNFATKLGRELIAKQAELNAFTAIYAALKG